MPLAHRLRKHADYGHAYKAAGRKQWGKQMAYFAAPRSPDRRADTAGPRIGLTVPKALGKAHDRNRIKRRLREAVRAHLGLLTAPVDLILHPKRSVLTCEYAELSREIAVIFRAVQNRAEQGRAVQGRPEQGRAVPGTRAQNLVHDLQGSFETPRPAAESSPADASTQPPLALPSGRNSA